MSASAPARARSDASSPKPPRDEAQLAAGLGDSLGGLGDVGLGLREHRVVGVDGVDRHAPARERDRVPRAARAHVDDASRARPRRTRARKNGSSRASRASQFTNVS